MDEDAIRYFLDAEPQAEHREGARAMRRLYVAWLEVGFTREEAMQMLLHVLTGQRA